MNEIYLMEIFAGNSIEDATFSDNTRIMVFDSYKILANNIMKVLGYVGNSQIMIEKREEINQDLIKQLGENKFARFQHPQGGFDFFNIQVALLEIMEE